MVIMQTFAFIQPLLPCPLPHCFKSHAENPLSESVTIWQILIHLFPQKIEENVLIKHS